MLTLSSYSFGFPDSWSTRPPLLQDGGYLPAYREDTLLPPLTDGYSSYGAVEAIPVSSSYESFMPVSSRSYSGYDPTVRDATEVPPEQAGALRTGWFDVYPENWGWDSYSLKSASSIIDTFSSLSRSQTDYRQQSYNYGLQADFYDRQSTQFNAQADYLRKQASTNYEIAAMNLARTRESQRSYLGQQLVSAVNTGVALDSGSVNAVRRATMSEFERQVFDAADSAEQARQTSVYQADVASWQAEAASVQAGNLRRQQSAAKRNARASGIGKLFSVAGAVGGSIFGGPVGGAIGAQAGGSIGSSLGRLF